MTPRPPRVGVGMTSVLVDRAADAAYVAREAADLGLDHPRSATT